MSEPRVSVPVDLFSFMDRIASAALNSQPKLSADEIVEWWARLTEAADVPTPERLRKWAEWSDKRLLHAMDAKGTYHPAGRWLRLIADALEASEETR